MILGDEGEPKRGATDAKLTFNCEYCSKDFEHEFSTPLAVTCSCCGSTFDGRLQLIKGYRREFKKLTT